MCIIDLMDRKCAISRNDISSAISICTIILILLLCHSVTDILTTKKKMRKIEFTTFKKVVISGSPFSLGHAETKSSGFKGLEYNYVFVFIFWTWVSQFSFRFLFAILTWVKCWPVARIFAAFSLLTVDYFTHSYTFLFWLLREQNLHNFLKHSSNIWVVLAVKRTKCAQFLKAFK